MAIIASIKDGISAISEEIDDMIQKEVQSILEEAENKKDQIIKENDKEIEEKLYKLEKETEKIIKNEEHKINSLIKLETNRNMLNLKDKLINEVFYKLKEKLKDFTNTKQYMKKLQNLITEGIEKIININKEIEEITNLSLIIGLNQIDKEKISTNWLESLENKFNTKLELSSPIQTIGGVKISTEDGKITIDSTFEEYLSHKNIQTRIKIASILFSEDNT